MTVRLFPHLPSVPLRALENLRTNTITSGRLTITERASSPAANDRGTTRNNRRNNGARPRTPHLPADQGAATEAARIAASCPDPGRNTKDRFKCAFPECGKAFQRRYNLKVHARKHTKETPYGCREPGCLKKFKWRSSMAHHQKTHRKPASSSSQSTTHSTLSTQNGSLPSFQSLQLNGPPSAASAQTSTVETTPQFTIQRTFAVSPVTLANAEQEPSNEMYVVAGSVASQPLTQFAAAHASLQQPQNDNYGDMDVEGTDFRATTAQSSQRSILDVKREDRFYGPLPQSQDPVENTMPNPMPFDDYGYADDQAGEEGLDNFMITNMWSGDPPQN